MDWGNGRLIPTLVVLLAAGLAGVVATHVWARSGSRRLQERVAAVEEAGYRLERVRFGGASFPVYRRHAPEPPAALDAATILDFVAWQTHVTRRIPRTALEPLASTWRGLIRTALTAPEFSPRGPAHLLAVGRLGWRPGDVEWQVRWAAGRGSIVLEAAMHLKSAKERGLLTPAVAARCLVALDETMSLWLRPPGVLLEQALANRLARLREHKRHRRIDHSALFYYRANRTVAVLEDARRWIDGDLVTVRRRIDTEVPKRARRELHRVLDAWATNLWGWRVARYWCHAAIDPDTPLPISPWTGKPHAPDMFANPALQSSMR